MIKIELTFTKGHITRDMKGNFNVILEVPKDQEHNMEPLNELLSDEKVKTCKIGHYKKKRSLNSNSYAWTLITQIADKLRSSKEEVYLQMLKRYGPSSVISIVEEAAEVFEKSVKYSERFGESILNNKNFVHIKVFMGSSEFSTSQMSIFLDGIISECTDLRIPTMTPNEVQRLKEQWGR